MNDRGVVHDLLGARAAAAGYEALVLTVDVAVAGVRERDVRNRFSVPPRLTLRALAQGVTPPALVGAASSRARGSPPATSRYAGGGAAEPRRVRQPPVRPVA